MSRIVLHESVVGISTRVGRVSEEEETSMLAPIFVRKELKIELKFAFGLRRERIEKEQDRRNYVHQKIPFHEVSPECLVMAICLSVIVLLFTKECENVTHEQNRRGSERYHLHRYSHHIVLL